MSKIVLLFSQNSILEAVCMGIIFLLLAIGFYLFLSNVVVVRSARNNLNRLYTSLHAADKRRVYDIEQERRNYGSTSTDGKKSGIAKFLEKIDDVLIYSGMEAKYQFLNTTTYIFLTVLVWAVLILVVLLFVQNVVIALIVASVLSTVAYIYMSMKKDDNYRDTENHLSYLINSVANHSMDTSDLLQVFEAVVSETCEPVRSVLYRGITRAKISGNVSDCVELLTREIEHPIFIRFIRALDMASQNDADYRSVPKDFSVQAEREIRSMERQRAIFANGRSSILLLGVLGIVLNVIMCSLVEMPVLTVLMSMTQSGFGIFVIIAEAIIYCGLAMYLLIGSRK